MKATRQGWDRNLVDRIVCLGEAVLGVLLLWNPVGFAAAVLRVLGVVLALLGLARLAGYARAEPAVAAQGGGLVTGLVFLLAGGFCFFRWEWFVLTFPILTALYGVVTLVNGLHKLQRAVDLWRLGRPHWHLALAGAALTLGFGVLILADPFATVALLWKFIAITFLIEAVVDLAGFLLGRRPVTP